MKSMKIVLFFTVMSSCNVIPAADDPLSPMLNFFDDNFTENSSLIDELSSVPRFELSFAEQEELNNLLSRLNGDNTDEARLQDDDSSEAQSSVDESASISFIPDFTDAERERLFGDYVNNLAKADESSHVRFIPDSADDLSYLQADAPELLYQAPAESRKRDRISEDANESSDKRQRQRKGWTCRSCKNVFPTQRLLRAHAQKMGHTAAPLELLEYQRNYRNLKAIDQPAVEQLIKNIRSTIKPYRD